MDIVGLTDHVVICNWNEHARRLITDLRKADARSRVVVLNAQDTIPRMVDPNIHYVVKDPTTAEGLSAARVDHAKVVVILAAHVDGRSSQDIDARSILTVLAIEKQNSRVHTIVELLNEENVFHVKNANVDEVIVSGAYTGTMLSQSVQFPGVSDVYGDMFRSGAGSRMSELPLPKRLYGKRFSEVFAALFQDQQGILVGYRRNGNVEVSPPSDLPLKEGDRVILVQRVAS